MSRSCFIIASLALSVSMLGCGRSWQEQDIEVKASNDPLFQARSMLEGYSKGQPLTSEVANYPRMVEDVRKVDPTRAAILEKGLAEIKAAPANRAAKAKELLAKLQPAIN